MYSLNGYSRLVKSVRVPPLAVARFTSMLKVKFGYTPACVCPVKAMWVLLGDQYGRKAVQVDVGEVITLHCVPFGLIVDIEEPVLMNDVKAIFVPSGDHCGAFE